MTWVKAIHIVMVVRCVFSVRHPRFVICHRMFSPLYANECNLWCACYGCKQRDGALVPQRPSFFGVANARDTITQFQKQHQRSTFDSREFDNHSFTSTHSIYTFYYRYHDYYGYLNYDWLSQCWCGGAAAGAVTILQSVWVAHNSNTSNTILIQGVSMERAITIQINIFFLLSRNDKQLCNNSLETEHMQPSEYEAVFEYNGS